MKKRPRFLSKNTLPPVGTVYAFQSNGGNRGVARVIAVRTPHDPNLEPYEREYAAFVAVTKCHSDAFNESTARELYYGPDGLRGVWVGQVPSSTYRVVGILEPTPAERDAVRIGVSSWEWLGAEVDWQLGTKKLVLPKQADGSPVQVSRAKPKTLAEAQAALNDVILAEWKDYCPKRLIKTIKELTTSAIERLSSLPENDVQRKRGVITGLVGSLLELDSKEEFLSTIEREDLSEWLNMVIALSGLDSDFADRATGQLNAL